LTRFSRIETERLLLREPLPSDATRWGPLLADPDFRRYIPVRRSDERPEERASRNLDALAARWETEPLVAAGWVISRRVDGQIIGTGGVEQAEDPNDGEIDYFLGKPFWGEGYGREAARAMARFAVENMPFQRLVAYIVPGNIGSIRIAEGLGMRFERVIDYLQFFPDPSVIELSDPMTRMYAAPRADVVFGDGQYRVVIQDG